MFNITEQLYDNPTALDYLVDMLEQKGIDTIEFEPDLEDNVTGVTITLDNGRVLALEGRDLKVFIN